MVYIGIDIGGTLVKLGIFNEYGKLLHKWSIPTNVKDNGSHVMTDVADSVKSTLEKKGISFDDVAGFGVGVPGAVRNDGSVNKCTNLGWGDLPVKDMMSNLLDKKLVAIINDANAAALGEQWMGAGKGLNNLVLITIGTGIGGGVIVNNEVVSGYFSGGGEIGHITVKPDDNEVCACGKVGCLELHASATGMVSHMKQYLKEPNVKSMLKSASDISAKDIWDAAKEGDAAAYHVANECCRLIGVALANVSCTIDPEAFIIGGGVSKAGEYIVKLIQKHYRKYAFHTSVDTPFSLAVLGNDAGIYGAAYEAKKYYDGL